MWLWPAFWTGRSIRPHLHQISFGARGEQCVGLFLFPRTGRISYTAGPQERRRPGDIICNKVCGRFWTEGGFSAMRVAVLADTHWKGSDAVPEHVLELLEGAEVII